MRAGLAAFLLVLVTPELRAQPAPPPATVDWARGLVIVKTFGTADRRAPSPASARPVALREAEDRAAAGLVAAAKELPGAAGVSDDVVDGTIVELATEYLADGSVRIQRGLPIEAVRQAIDGPRPVSPAWDGAPAAEPATLVVDARNLKVTPRVGIGVSDGTTTARPPALWRTTPPKGSKPVAASAYDAAAGTLTIDRAPDPGALLVVVIRETS